MQPGGGSAERRELRRAAQSWAAARPGPSWPETLGAVGPWPYRRRPQGPGVYRGLNHRAPPEERVDVSVGDSVSGRVRTG